LLLPLLAAAAFAWPLGTDAGDFKSGSDFGLFANVLGSIGVVGAAAVAGGAKLVSAVVDGAKVVGSWVVQHPWETAGLVALGVGVVVTGGVLAVGAAPGAAVMLGLSAAGTAATVGGVTVAVTKVATGTFTWEDILPTVLSVIPGGIITKTLGRVVKPLAPLAKPFLPLLNRAGNVILAGPTRGAGAIAPLARSRLLSPLLKPIGKFILGRNPIARLILGEAGTFSNSVVRGISTVTDEAVAAAAGGYKKMVIRRVRDAETTVNSITQKYGVEGVKVFEVNGPHPVAGWPAWASRSANEIYMYLDGLPGEQTVANALDHELGHILFKNEKFIREYFPNIEAKAWKTIAKDNRLEEAFVDLIASIRNSAYELSFRIWKGGIYDAYRRPLLMALISWAKNNGYQGLAGDLVNINLRTPAIHFLPSIAVGAAGITGLTLAESAQAASVVAPTPGQAAPNGIGNFFSTVGTRFASGLNSVGKAAASAVSTTLTSLVSTAKNTFQRTVDTGKAFATKMVEVGKQAVTTGLSAAANAVKTFATAVSTNAKAAASTAQKAVTTGLTVAASTARKVVSGVTTAVNNAANSVKSFFGGLFDSKPAPPAPRPSALASRSSSYSSSGGSRSGRSGDSRGGGGRR